MKDFYDIYYLAINYDFEGGKLQEAISKTFINRGRILNKSVLAKLRQLKNDHDFGKVWENFIENTLKIKLDFKTVNDLIITFVGAPFENICNKQDFIKRWNKDKRQWN